MYRLHFLSVMICYTDILFSIALTGGATKEQTLTAGSKYLSIFSSSHESSNIISRYLCVQFYLCTSKQTAC